MSKETIDVKNRREAFKTALGLGAIGISAAAAVTYSGETHASTLTGTEVNAVDTTDTDLTGISPSDRTDGDVVYTTGYYASNDAGGGHYKFDTSVTSGENGGTIIKPVDVTSNDGRWILLNKGPLNVKDFGATGDGSTDDADAINAALDASGYTQAVYIPEGIYRISSPVRIKRLKSLIGDGRAIIKADFSSWTSGDSEGDLIAVQVEMDDSAVANDVFRSMGRQIGEFRIEGVNNTTLETHGMRIYANRPILQGNATNYSLTMSRLQNIHIENFDTAIQVREFYNSYVSGISSAHTRIGIDIQGRCINVNFQGCKLSNFDKSHTSNTGDMIAVAINAGLHYLEDDNGAHAGTPEGGTFSNCLLNDADHALVISRAYHWVFENCIMDASKDNAVEIDDPAMLVIKHCYILTKAPDRAGIYVQENIGVSAATGLAVDRQLIIDGNLITCAPDAPSVVTTGSNGIGFENAGTAREGISIINNKFDNWDKVIYCPIGINRSVIRDNNAHNVATVFAEFGDNMVKSLFDGNTTDNSVDILRLSASVDSTFAIGKNFSETTSTYFSGKGTITSGTNALTLTNDILNDNPNDTYIRVITMVQFHNDPGDTYRVEAGYDKNSARITVNSNVSADTVVFWEDRSVPHAAVQ